jgi:PTS system nitrogen regulatory IIA component
MWLEEVLHADDVTTELPPAGKDATLRGLARLFSRNHDVLDEDTVYRVLADRERVGSTAVGSGVAMPHGHIQLERPLMALAICRDGNGVSFDSLDGEPARIVLALLTPHGRPGGQIKMLARMSRVLRDRAVRERLLQATCGDDALRIMLEEDLRH